MNVAVVGAGIIGCAVAHELASRGAAVTVFERRGIARGASWASAGVLAPWIEAWHAREQSGVSGAPRATEPGGVRGSPPDDNDAPRVFIYDHYPGGIGFSEPLFLMHQLLLERAREVIGECPCVHGCPSCVGPEGNQGPLAKAVALRLLDVLLAAEAAA